MKEIKIHFSFERVIWSQGSTDFLSSYLSVISGSSSSSDDDDDDFDDNT